MAKTTNNITKWSDIKKSLKELSQDELINLIKDIYDRSKDSKIFLSARFCKDNRAVYNEYRKKVIEPFFPQRGEPKLKYGPAKKAITDYTKATNDLMGTLDLMLTYVEAGTQFTYNYGDIDEPFYDSLDSMMWKFHNLIESKSDEYLEPFVERLRIIAEKASVCGWGYSDSIGDAVLSLGIEYDREAGYKYNRYYDFV